MKNKPSKESTDLVTKTLESVGVKQGQILLDFGCGTGDYSIPAAQIVGDKGLVYALDMDEASLQDLRHYAQSQQVENIKTIKTSGELKIPVENNSVDFVLLYDVLHSYYFTVSERQILYNEIFRIAKPGAIISIFPKHINWEILMNELEHAKFHFKEKHFVTLLHYHGVDRDNVFNFCLA